MTALLPLVPGLPLLMALMLIPRRLRAVVWNLAPLAAVPGLGLALAGEQDLHLHIPWLLFGLDLGLDGTGRSFLLLTGLLWIFAALFGRVLLRNDPARHRYLAFFLLAAAGNLGVTVTHDAAGFYLFFALMTFAAYGLVVHRNTPRARRAGRVYIVLALVGEAALLTAMILIAAAGGGLLPETAAAVAASPWRNAIIALLTVGFGVKTGLPLLHMALPLAYRAAPLPAAAALAGAMIHAGLLGWLRFLPLGETAVSGWGTALVALGIAAAFYGVAVGLAQRDPRALLAYSSISQTGYMTLGIGAALLRPELAPLLIPAVTLFAVHHGLAKTALFLGLGALRAARSRWAPAGLALPALALAGAPFTSGVLAKIELKHALTGLPLSWLAWLIPLATIGTTLLMARFLFLLRPRPTPERRLRGLVPAWIAALLALALLPWWMAPADAVARAFAPAALWAGTWPVLLGLTVALAWLRRPAAPALPQIPPGDVLAWMAPPLLRLWRGVRREVAWPVPHAGRPVSAAWMTRLESLFRDWGIGGVLWLTIVLSLFALFSW